METVGLGLRSNCMAALEKEARVKEFINAGALYRPIHIKKLEGTKKDKHVTLGPQRQLDQHSGTYIISFQVKRIWLSLVLLT